MPGKRDEGNRRIVSRHNPLIKQVRLWGSRPVKDAAGETVTVIEGVRLLEEGLRASQQPDRRFSLEMIFFSEEAVSGEREKAFLKTAREAGIEVIEVTPAVMEHISQLAAPPGMLGVVRCRSAERESVAAKKSADPLLLILDGLQDPGNVGTLIRTAEAAGADAVWLTAGTVHPFSSRVIKATMGSIFRVRLRWGVGEEDFDWLEAKGFKIVGAAVQKGRPFYGEDFSSCTALVLGNEAHGISEKMSRRVTSWVHIPMAGEVDSLNVAVAGSLLLYEAFRQRRLLA